MKPYISVVIPCYNKEAFIAEALDSVLQQTYAHAIGEIIVVDDGSADRSAQVVRAKAVQHPVIKYVSQPNAGVSAARNTGIAQAQGDYIAFLDADDLWLPDKIEKQHEAAVQYPNAGLFYTDLYKYYYRQHKLSPVYVIPYHATDSNILFRFVARGAPVIPSTVLVKKGCFNEVGLFDTSLHEGGEDIDMWLRIARKYPFHHVKGCLVKKRELTRSLGANTFENAKGYKIALDKLQQEEPAIAPYRRKRDALIHYKVGLYFYKQGELSKAIQEVKQSFRKNIRQYKAYLLWFAIVMRQWLGLRLLKS